MPSSPHQDGARSLTTTIQDWGNFGQVAGQASGALIGLLFVAVSLNRDRIAQHVALRSSALETLAVFMLPLVVSVVLLTPGQSLKALGFELIALGIGHGMVVAIAGHSKRKARQEHDSRLARLLDQFTPSFITTILVVAAGTTLAKGYPEGLYCLVPAVLLALIGGVANAWLFLIHDPD